MSPFVLHPFVLHDTKGNMTTDDRGCGMAWDFDNMLQSFAANGVTDLKNVTNEFDAIGRHVAMVASNARIEPCPFGENGLVSAKTLKELEKIYNEQNGLD